MGETRQQLGAAGEEAAAQFLRRHRYTILARNYRCPQGEIDLVALDGRTLVFVEVKTRRGASFGTPFDAVDTRKQRQVTRAAQHYISAHRLEDRLARFDVVGVDWVDGRPLCELIQHAFDAA